MTAGPPERLPPDFWEARFQQNTTPWERDGVHPAFIDWRAGGELAPCRILVPGAGRSREPAVLLAAGFDVTALDLAESAVAFQAEALGRARAVQGDVTAWQPPAPFEAVYDQTCLCALPPALWPGYAARLRDWLRPGGRLFALFMQTGREGGPPFDCPLPEMRRLFAEWEWPPAPGRAVPHNMGSELPMVLIRR